MAVVSIPVGEALLKFRTRVSAWAWNKIICFRVEIDIHIVLKRVERGI